MGHDVPDAGGEEGLDSAFVSDLVSLLDPLSDDELPFEPELLLELLDEE